MKDGKFSITKWEETSAEPLPAPMKFNRGRVERLHSGVLEGTEVMQYTFLYSDDTRSEFVGIGIFEGSVAGVSGRFAVIERGSYVDGAAHTVFDVRDLASDLSVSLGTGEYSTSEHVDVGYVFTS